MSLVGSLESVSVASGCFSGRMLGLSLFLTEDDLPSDFDSSEKDLMV